MKSFTQLRKNLKKDFSPFPKLRVALLGDTATQFLKIALQGLGYDKSIYLDIWEAEFNQIERQVLDPTSELYEWNPEVVVVFRSAHKLIGKYNKATLSSKKNFADNELTSITELREAISSGTSAKIIFFNYNEIDDAIFGSYSNKVESSFLFQLRKLNFKLAEYALVQPNLFVCDLSTVQNEVGKQAFFQSSIYISTEMVLSLEVLPKVAERTLAILLALQGKFNKCIILDLDNTTWGGIIGDDGVENIQIGSLGIGKAFTEFQFWVKKLKERGIIVAVCSKNTDSVARVPFEKHPDMVLRLDDIAVFVANWENKADNIRHIQEVLNIGFDSMVFIDDNPFERNIVRDNLPEVIVPELPEDPADYLEFLYSQNLFETVTHSQEDSERTKMYQVEAQRSKIKKRFTNEDEFLENLKMTSKVESFTSFNIPRVAQLSMRSNQFNLRTIRYTEEEIKSITKADDHFTFSFGLEDKFGDNGLICVVILEQKSTKDIFIDTWFMSCRVLKRGMESFVLNTIVSFALGKGYVNLLGEYLPTTKNEMVKKHYEELGFIEENGNWKLELSNFKERKNYILKK